jgi:wobble nucleotide-excising tRNase
MKAVLDDIFGEGEQTLETLCSYTEFICDKYEDLSLQKGLAEIDLEDKPQSELPMTDE